MGYKEKTLLFAIRKTLCYNQNNNKWKGMFMATAYKEDKPYIFLSYARKDKDLAHFVVESLQEYFEVWFDEGIHTGTRWEEVIADKIESPNCWMMVFLATQNSLASKWCANELSLARDEGKKFINVVIGNPTFPAWFKLSYSSYQFLYEKNFTNREAMLEKLVEDLLQHEMNPDKPQLFYVWGHSYEFPMKDNWQVIERFCERIAGKSDIFYGTNKEVLLG